ncbi:MAG: hypothetical protein HW416_3595, partial [Chloroflexi bacterium]|nr:hypothetical protein [Chloroflexota bacterium]
EAADDVEEGALAGAAGAHDGDELALVDVEVDLVEGVDEALAKGIAFADAPGFENDAGVQRSLPNPDRGC